MVTFFFKFFNKSMETKIFLEFESLFGRRCRNFVKTLFRNLKRISIFSTRNEYWLCRDSIREKPGNLNKMNDIAYQI